MEPITAAPHPDHPIINKSLLQHAIDWGLPILVFLKYFILYSHGVVSNSEVIKTTGLTAIALLSITLAIGSLSRFFPIFNSLKVHRKVWGISSFVFALIHGLLVFIYYFKLDFLIFFNYQSPRFFTPITGLLSLLMLLIITASSFQLIFRKLPPHMWKHIQNLSYIALFFAVVHYFYAGDMQNMIASTTYWYAIVVLLLRAIVFIFPKKESLNPPVSS